jgi:drug/metabolite transporter (DMT)-like permease
MVGLRFGHQPVTSDNTGRAVLMILTSALSFAMVGVMVRLSGDLPVYEKVFVRSLVSLAATGAVALRNRHNPFVRTTRTPFLILRGVFGTIAMTLYFYAISNLTLADATILNKLSPFFVAIFAVLFLNERLSPYVIPVLVAAFAGAALVVKPQLDLRALPAAAGFISAAASGAAYTVVRSLRGKEPPYKIVFFFALVSTVVMLPPTVLRFVTPTPVQYAQLLGAGVFATIGQFSLTYAYHQAPATRISIYNYAHVVFALLIGLAVWHELPDLLSLVGMLVIMAAAVYNYSRALGERHVPPPA